MDVKESRPVTWAEALAILEAKEGKRELGYVQKNALDYLRKFTALKPKEAQELAAELAAVEKLKDGQIVAIVNLLPKSEEELRQLMQHELVTLSEDEAKQVLSLVKKHA